MDGGRNRFLFFVWVPEKRAGNPTSAPPLLAFRAASRKIILREKKTTLLKTAFGGGEGNLANTSQLDLSTAWRGLVPVTPHVVEKATHGTVFLNHLQ